MAVSGMFAACYGVFRFIVEFVRVPDAQLGYLAWGWLTMGQILCLPMILGGIGLIAYAYKRQPRVRLPDAFRPGRWFPHRHHQEVPPALDHPRAAVVPPGRHQHQVPQGQRRQHLGRVGRRERQPRPGLRLPVAQLAGAQRRVHRPDQQAGRDDPQQPGLAPSDRLGLEPGAGRADGAAALSCAVPVLRRRRQAVLPALPALGGHLPRRALQHRQLRPADADGGAGLRPAAGRVHLDRR
ncbi:UNVERIFIED_CONTAM: lgt [Trichonephila clavipes]